MKIRNKKNGFNKLHYRVGGMPKIVEIGAGKTVDLPDLKRKEDIINIGEFKRGFFEVVIEQPIPEVNKEIKETESPKAIDLDEAREGVKKYSKKKSKKKTKKEDN
jgi:hypothetical protein